jgi:putative ABC transport system permease protein
VQNEWSYDKHHSKKNRIYRISSTLNLGGEETKAGLSSYMLSPTIKQDYPEVEESIRVMPVGKQTMWADEKPFQFKDNLMSEGGFFYLFDYTFIEGNPKTALVEPQSVVITDEVAKKMFGKTLDVVGKTIRYARQSYKITGVIQDQKNNSHLYFNTILSLNSIQPQLENTLRNDWFYLAQSNYVLFKQPTDAIGFETKLAQLRDKYIVPWLKQVNSEGKITYKLQPLASLHLNAEFPASYAKTGNKSYLYIFSILAIFILAIACINYINLATATATKRAKEIGIRKTLGANFPLLFKQFITESFLVAFIAMAIALVWINLLLPVFNQITDKSLHINYQPSLIISLLIFLIVVSFMAGAYPALYLSRLQPMLALKSAKTPGGFALLIRKLLLTLQFAIAILFFCCTVIIFSQMQFIKNKSLGFNKNQTLVVNVPVPDTSFVGKFELVKQELLQHTGVIKLALTNNIPGAQTGNLFHAIETPDFQKQERAISYMIVSHDFLPLLEIPLIKGRNFSRNFPSDNTGAFIVNEKAVKTYGWKDPLNCQLENGFGYKGKIIGVVKDFNFKSLHDPIEPLVMMLGGNMQGNLLIKIQQGKEAEIIKRVEEIWGKYSKKYPVEYFFLDDNFNTLYLNEERMMHVFTNFSVISLLLCCIGLYALITYVLEQRVKEIGIRKVMGATTKNIVIIINKEYLLLWFVASVIAVTFSMYIMLQWLKNFAYRVDLSAWMFLGSSAVMFVLAISIISIKTYKSASQNPVNSLRYE